MSERVRRVNELIREEASKAIAEKIKTGDLLTVKAVETERDLKHARVWISVFGDEEKAICALKQKASEIERLVRSKMYSKYTPKLEFKIDRSEEYVAKIDRLLNEK